MALYNFVKNQWIMGRYTESQVRNAVTKGYVTQAECGEILDTPQTT